VARIQLSSILQTHCDYGPFNLVRFRGSCRNSGLASSHSLTLVSGVILVTTNLLAILLGKIRQPKVLAEIIGGIILGPTVMGRIPGFTQHIFPPESRPYLSLGKRLDTVQLYSLIIGTFFFSVADIGLVLFLFIIGLEIDVKMVKRNLRTSMIIAGSGMLLPFGLGAAIAVPLYHQFINPANSSFGANTSSDHGHRYLIRKL
jgi:Kef-type K+ transport system membrane component KefB